MQARKDMIGVVCEALNRLFSTNQDQLISQVDAAQYLPSVSTMN
jgi:DnaJ family protein C protein 13